MFTIGDFSRASGLTVKALHFYHEQGILVPAHIDTDNGYRYYSTEQLETGLVIVKLKELGLSIKEIGTLLADQSAADVLEVLEVKLAQVAEEIKLARKTEKQLREIIQMEKNNRQRMVDFNFDIEEKTTDSMLIAGLRIRGRYQDCGKGFSQVGRNYGRFICGPAMMLVYDKEYKEDDADFETCMPIKKGESRKGLEVRELPATDCVTLLHQGPYSALHRSYQKILQHIREQKLQVAAPSREVYHKGPGMIFKGNPEKYLTEIQFPVVEQA